jgi:hypothetical protein
MKEIRMPISSKPSAQGGRRNFLKTLSSGALMAVIPGLGLARPEHADATRVDGDWAVSLDRNDQGIAQGWFRRPLSAPAPVRDSLPAQALGDAVTIDTPWTCSLANKQFFTAPDYAPYRAPGQVKVPFFLQPDTWYVGPAWFELTP